uniref:Myosin motor domain-containing protein n=1 Tax=Macrostomum lignano TaxID=282301 RepID=A0A1I8HQM6_9PLAT
QIQYFNNEPICELIDRPTSGLFALLDETCLRPGQLTDREFLARCEREFQQRPSPHFDSRKLSPADKAMQHERDFRITHYAGAVVYSVENFLDKNKDTLYQDFKRLLYSSSDRHLSCQWPEGAEASNRVQKRPPSAGLLFKQSIQALVQRLAGMRPHYVRCLKPNGSKQPGSFDSRRYLNLLESARVRRAGFALRLPYPYFLQRYKLCDSPAVWPHPPPGMPPRDAARSILARLQLDSEDRVRYGVSKLFVRHARTVFALEQARVRALPAVVTVIQKHYRGRLGRIYFAKYRLAVWIQTRVRGLLARRRFARLRAACIIARRYRRYKIRAHVLRVCAAFDGVARRKDLGRGVEWPERPPAALAGLLAELRRVHNRWRAERMLASIPRHERPEFRLKLASCELLLGTDRLRAGLPRHWLGEYQLPRPRAAAKMPGQLLFSHPVVKAERGGAFKMTRRCLLISGLGVAKADQRGANLVGPVRPLAGLAWLSLTRSAGDPAVCLAFDGRGAGGDLLMILTTEAGAPLTGEERLTELVAVLRRACQLAGRDLPVRLADRLTFRCHGNSKPACQVEVKQAAEAGGGPRHDAEAFFCFCIRRNCLGSMPSSASRCSLICSRPSEPGFFFCFFLLFCCTVFCFCEEASLLPRPRLLLSVFSSFFFRLLLLLSLLSPAFLLSCRTGRLARQVHPGGGCCGPGLRVRIGRRSLQPLHHAGHELRLALLSARASKSAPVAPVGLALAVLAGLAHGAPAVQLPVVCQQNLHGAQTEIVGLHLAGMESVNPVGLVLQPAAKLLHRLAGLALAFIFVLAELRLRRRLLVTMSLAKSSPNRLAIRRSCSAGSKSSSRKSPPRVSASRSWPASPSPSPSLATSPMPAFRRSRSSRRSSSAAFILAAASNSRRLASRSARRRSRSSARRRDRSASAVDWRSESPIRRGRSASSSSAAGCGGFRPRRSSSRSSSAAVCSSSSSSWAVAGQAFLATNSSSSSESPSSCPSPLAKVRWKPDSNSGSRSSVRPFQRDSNSDCLVKKASSSDRAASEFDSDGASAGCCWRCRGRRQNSLVMKSRRSALHSGSSPSPESLGSATNRCKRSIGSSPSPSPFACWSPGRRFTRKSSSSSSSLPSLPLALALESLALQ